MVYAPDLTISLKTSCNIILQTEERRKEIVWALHSDYTKEIDACLWRMNVIFSSFFLSFFIYLGFYIAFNTVQVISRQVVGRAEETSTYSSTGFCTVNC